eukprot:jgi/Astpho2/9984/Aster-06794
MSMRIGQQDIGGREEDMGPIDRTEKTLQEWELQTHSLVSLLSTKGLLSVDELRRGLEDLPEAAYKHRSYYEKWAASVASIQMERGNISQRDIDAAMGKPVTEPEVKFKEGDVVRVRREDSAVRWRRPHLRTPEGVLGFEAFASTQPQAKMWPAGYLFGVCGVIERECVGYAEHPEGLAFRQNIPRQPLYRVRFHQQALWEGYTGFAKDTADVEIYQPWLEPASQEQLQSQLEDAQRRSSLITQQRQDPAHEHSHSHSQGHGQPQQHEHSHEHAHGHEHGHEHSHEHGHDHVHEGRSVVEQNAVDAEGDDQERRRLTDALVKIFTSKGIITANELREATEALDSKGRKQLGAQLVARAWTDPPFKARLLKNAAGAAAEMGIPSSNFTPKKLPPGYNVLGGPESFYHAGLSLFPDEVFQRLLLTRLRALQVHNLIVCTLCSCYPISVLGASPPWYKSSQELLHAACRSYRARAIREPRAVLSEFGLEVDPDVAVRVHDSTADMRYMVLPQRPSNTEGWSPEKLMELVTRDSMLGVARAKMPAQ